MTCVFYKRISSQMGLSISYWGNLKGLASHLWQSSTIGRAILLVDPSSSLSLPLPFSPLILTHHIFLNHFLLFSLFFLLGMIYRAREMLSWDLDPSSRYFLPPYHFLPSALPPPLSLSSPPLPSPPIFFVFPNLEVTGLTRVAVNSLRTRRRRITSRFSKNEIS